MRSDLSRLRQALSRNEQIAYLTGASDSFLLRRSVVAFSISIVLPVFNSENCEFTLSLNIVFISFGKSSPSSSSLNR